MKTVGLRELKNRLSAYIRYVRAGEAVVVTDRGQVVAELRAPGSVPAGANVDPAVAALVNRGVLTLGAPNAARAYPPLPPLLRATTAAMLLRAERGPR